MLKTNYKPFYAKHVFGTQRIFLQRIIGQQNDSFGRFKFISTNKPIEILKKSAIIVTVIAVAAMIFSSCRTTENCPAYGKVDTPVEQGVNS